MRATSMAVVLLTACGASTAPERAAEEAGARPSLSFTPQPGGWAPERLCAPVKREEACAGGACGAVPDGCGDNVYCGTCPYERAPFTCAEVGANCGALDDGWGGTLECGDCPGAMRCSASNVCGDANARFEQLSAGPRHTCGTMSNGSLWCWGDNTFGQLGDETLGRRSTPTQVGKSLEWAAVAAGAMHSCALKRDGSLWCWGEGSGGALGTGSRFTAGSPARVGMSDRWRALALGDDSTCALRTDGTLWCWGRLVTLEATGAVPRVDVPALISSDGHWKSLELSGGTLCAVDTSGVLECWEQTLLAGGGAAVVNARRPGAWQGVTLSAEGAWAVGSDGTLWSGPWHQLTRFDLSTTWSTAVRAGPGSCGLRDDGELWCWDTAAPVRLGTARWLTLTGAAERFCAVRDDGSTWCWGDNAYGQLGLDSGGERIGAPTQLHP